MTDDQIMKVVDRAVDCFQGDLNGLESAIGMLLIGRHYGWRVVFLIHSPATIRKDTRLLGLKNLRERLKLAYGADASFVIAANFPNGVAATITLPLAATATAGASHA